jgi:hypothetical protein
MFYIYIPELAITVTDKLLADWYMWNLISIDYSRTVKLAEKLLAG